jgi:predicted ATP-grasp superfamily ATP-dependent carboligase
VLKQFVLQIAIKAVNNIAGPNGLVSTLLVFSTYPQITTTNTLSLTVTKRDKTITKAIKQIVELHTKRQVTDVLRQQNGPNISNTLNILINKDVLVYKEDKG